MGVKSSIPSETLILVDYVPGKRWHRYESTGRWDLPFNFLSSEVPKFNRVLLGNDYPNLQHRPVQETFELPNRGTDMNSRVFIKEEKNYIVPYYEGWTKILDESSFKSYEIYNIKNPETLDLFYDLSLENIIKRLKLEKKKIYIFIAEDDILFEEDSEKIKYNENLDSLTNPLTFEPKDYPYHLAHAVPKNVVSTIIKSRKICVDERCLTDIYHEPTGIFLYNEEKFKGGQYPGIYMELFQHSRIVPFTLPMELKDKFNHFRYLAADNFAAINYGEVGFIYNFEDIFSKYRVALKKDLNMGFGQNITLDEYINNFGGECIIRANQIPINNIFALYIKFTFTEIDFIYDKFKDKPNKTLLDVINLYLTFKRKIDGKLITPWFIRKSALKAVLEGYDIKNVKSKNLSKLPKIFAITPGRGFSNGKLVSIYNDPEQDVESDFDTYDPNLDPKFN